ncbi:collagen-like triple helix repeat-containing protein [Dialister micraerophilus]|uniref:collagen-like triple helix repeat-containing protein n=1 Tax=Dialister micraerophilus TaxID=309120 RepID=UPI0023F1F7D3|nr:collagen-like protein [Dialister micraerophilus]
MWRLIEMARKWLGNIRGPKGPQGEKGEKGPQGPQGIQGPKGEKGDIPNMDLYVKADKVYTKEEVDDKLEDKLDKIGLDLRLNLIGDDFYKKDECDKLFQKKGNYALKSDIPKAQDLTPYAKKTDLINKIEKKDIYQENFIKLPDGTLIGIETKSGGVNNNPINTKDLEDEIGNEPSIKHP